MAKIDIKTYKINYTDNFFFDTNVWLLLFGTIGDFQKNFQKQYSSFFSSLIEKNRTINITTLVISEISNVMLRIDFNQWKDKNKFYDKDFKKDFVGTEDYKRSVKSISIIINKILSLPNILKIPDDFHIMDVKSVLDDLEKIDFNDSVYTAICSTRNFKLVTNDADFLEVSNKIDVVTANC